MVKLLLQNKAEKNARAKAEGIPGSTPLHCAAMQGRSKVVKLLCEQGADVHAQDGHGRTPHSYAEEAGHRAVVLFLLDAGAK